MIFFVNIIILMYNYDYIFIKEIVQNLFERIKSIRHLNQMYLDNLNDVSLDSLKN